MSDISPESQPAIVGFELSALSAYSAAPGTIEGVSFWPRVAARMIDLVAHSHLIASVGEAGEILHVHGAKLPDIAHRLMFRVAKPVNPTLFSIPGSLSP